MPIGATFRGMMGAAGAGSAATVNYTDSEYQQRGRTTSPFTHSLNIGTATSRKVVVLVGTSGGAGATGATVKLDGEAMALIHSSVGGDLNECRLFQLNTTKGGTQTIVVQWASAAGHCSAGVWEVHGAADAVNDTLATGSDPFTGTIDVPAGGVCIAGGFFSNAQSVIWSAGVTEDYDDFGGQLLGTGASDAFATIQTGMTITCTSNGSNNRAALAVSWGPA